MNAVTLTPTQKTQALANKTVVANARAALQTALQAEIEYLQTAANAAGKRVQLSDDGTMVIIG
jgi:hypothetical protein